jgi:hypothetical protein
MNVCPYCKGTGKPLQFKVPENYMTTRALGALVGRCQKTILKHIRQGLLTAEVGERDCTYRRKSRNGGAHKVRAVHVAYLIKRDEAARYVAFIEQRGNRRPQKKSDKMLALLDKGESVERVALQFGVKRASVLAVVRRRKQPPRAARVPQEAMVA